MGTLVAVEAKRRRRLAADEVERVLGAVARASAAHPEVVLSCFHGSAARGEPAADIDIGVFVDPLAAPDPLAAFEVCSDIAARATREARPPLELDVRPLNGSGPAFRFAILSEGRVVYARSRDEQVVLQAEWASDWHDFRPFWDRQVRRLSGRRGA